MVSHVKFLKGGCTADQFILGNSRNTTLWIAVDFQGHYTLTYKIRIAKVVQLNAHKHIKKLG